MSAIRNLIYKFGWDTRCRNVDVARILRPFINSESTILDAGCGEYAAGFAASDKRKFVPGDRSRRVCVDRYDRLPSLSLKPGSIQLEKMSC